MTSYTRSSRANPCPICGRTRDGDCRILDSGLVFCHSERNGVIPGKQHPKKDFVYCGKSDEAQGFGIWKPLHLCTEPLKTRREPKTQFFQYRLWDGSPLKVSRKRTDYPDKPKWVGWEKRLNGTKEIEIAPYRWHKAMAEVVSVGVLVVLRGELKADLLAGRGIPAISVLAVGDRLVTELRKLIADGHTVALAPDCDLADLDHWYRDLTGAIPQLQTLQCPDKKMDWRSPPADGAVALRTGSPARAPAMTRSWQPSLHCDGSRQLKSPPPR
ncbi:hypothetical protein KR100_01930 [Synechococcus sp. KORDI-100]|uniref:hypothetical protein n=1 Tax=Synechococcus sp. KORDI-100 TaxID=1280380 RepID=UPI0004E09E29|nr:hypothetical protein [Synechococcus sp. KORDI-100]AII42164.1 hypothetical protein KR100_01930 [Synechococcus sp. KORDI-100]